METCSQSGDRELAEELLTFFVDKVFQSSSITSFLFFTVFNSRLSFLDVRCSAAAAVLSTT